MKKNSSAIIAALTLTAIILGVVLLAAPDRQAQASMLNAQPSFSIMSAGITGSDESLIIIDNAQEKILLYSLVNGKDLTFSGGYDFSKSFNPPK